MEPSLTLTSASSAGSTYAVFMVLSSRPHTVRKNASNRSELIVDVDDRELMLDGELDRGSESERLGEEDPLVDWE